MSAQITNRVAGLTLALLGISCAILAISSGLGQLNNPGPGMWPLITGLVLAGAAVATSVERSEIDGDSAGWRRAVIGAASLVVFLVLFNYLGLIVPGALVVFFWLRVLSGEKTVTSVVVAVVMSLSAYVLFVTVLGVPIRDVVASLWGG